MARYEVEIRFTPVAKSVITTLLDEDDVKDEVDDNILSLEAGGTITIKKIA